MNFLDSKSFALPPTGQSLSSSFITASQYCDFLNTTTSIDSDHLYDEKLGLDSISASIVRLGKPGAYHYDLIAGREDFLISYTSFFDELCYCKEVGDLSETILRKESSGDDFLKSNRSYFSIVASTGMPQLILGNEGVSFSDLQWNQWENGARNILIALGIFYFSYRMIDRCYESSADESELTTTSIRPDEEAVRRLSLIRTRREGEHGSLEDFHKESITQNRDENIKKFHQSCIEANQIELRLESVEREFISLNEKALIGKEAASEGVYRYGAIYVVSHAGSLALNILIPGSSVIAHTISDVAPLVISKFIHSVIDSSEIGTEITAQEDPNSWKSWTKWAVGKDVASTYEGVQKMKEAKSHLPATRGRFLQALGDYGKSVMEVDALYARAVYQQQMLKNQREKKRWWKKIKAKISSFRVQSSEQNSSHKEIFVPHGGFQHSVDTIYYRLYIRSSEEAAVEGDKIGAHLLDNRPQLAIDNNIFIQEVHVPAGTRLQQLNFLPPEGLHLRFKQFRLLDIIPTNCFKEGVRPDAIHEVQRLP